jgi:acetyl esterase/lipase
MKPLFCLLLLLRLSLSFADDAPTILENGIRQIDLTLATVPVRNGERDLRTRLWLPPEPAEGPYPVVIWVHGGGFIGGSHDMNLMSKRNPFASSLRALVEEGFAVASADYRLAREAPWPAPVEDPQTLIRFLDEHAGRWKLDMDRLGICGHSAGARITGLLGLMESENTPRAIQLWAGSIHEQPEIAHWTEFAKPKNYSVPRLLFGGHPAAHPETRVRLRDRTQAPHLAGPVPALRMVRGQDDYGGDHSDARLSVRLWTALNIPATLDIHPGGHSTTGPAEDTVAFFSRHLKSDPPFSPPGITPEQWADALLAEEQTPVAVDVLTQAAGGTDTPGDWLILVSDPMRSLYLPHAHYRTSGIWRKAVHSLAQRETNALKEAAANHQWVRARMALHNLQRLGTDAAGHHDIRDRITHENTVFTLLARANRLWHAGDREAATRLLSGDDPRIAAARERLQSSALSDPPAWAAASGVDVYGAWADLPVTDDLAVRLRRLDPADWELPKHLAFRNRTSDPFTAKVNIPRPVWLAEVETTHAVWKALGGRAIDGLEDAAPVCRIDYAEIVAWLDKLEKRFPDTVFRLPTESEWLHAATAGGRLDVRAAMDLHAADIGDIDLDAPAPLPAGSRLPQLGGYVDLLGNVMEWTASPGRNQSRITDDRGRFHIWSYPIARGGSWGHPAVLLSPALRQQQRHENRQPDLGFRLLISGHPEDRNWLKAVKPH